MKDSRISRDEVGMFGMKQIAEEYTKDYALSTDILLQHSDTTRQAL